MAATNLGSLAYRPSPSDIKTCSTEYEEKICYYGIFVILFYLSCLSHFVWQRKSKNVSVRSNDWPGNPLLKPQTHRFHKAGGTASLLVVLVMVLRWHLQVDRRVRPLGELRVVCVPGALAHRHLAASSAPPVWVVHTDKRGVVWWLVFTGRGGRGSGPGASGAGRGEAVGSAGVQACYSHNLMGQERHMIQTLCTAAQQAVVFLVIRGRYDKFASL